MHIDTPQTRCEDTAPPYVWLPAVDLLPGMVVARPVVAYSGSLETMHLPPGTLITAGTISQMIVKGVECAAVFDAGGAPPVEAEPAAQARRQAYCARLDEIFGTEPDDTCRPLRDALEVLGPAP